MTTALVTGANSGIGRATAVELAAQGFQVWAAMRDPDKADKLLAAASAVGAAERIEVVALDVTSDASVRAAFEHVHATTGALDVLVNNAGVGGNATVEEAPISLYQAVMDVNLYGAVRCCQAALPAMRAQRSGCVVNVTSVVGVIGALAQAPYTASKWALEGLSEQLALELQPFGIRVVIVQPGVTRSAIFPKNVDAPNSTGAYGDHYARMFEFYAAGLANATDAAEVGRVVHEAITTDRPRLRWPVSWGGVEITTNRRAMDDEDWVALGSLIPDATAYAERFTALFGVDVRPPR